MSSISKRPCIVVAGYGSWPTAKVNPCAQVVAALNNCAWNNCDFRGYEVPVVSDDLHENIATIIELTRPAAFIGLGVAVRYSAIKAELLGINKIDLSVPDAAGNLAGSKPIVKGGPLAYESTLPNDKIIKHLKKQKIPAMRSYYAGTHLCNQMLYTSSHIASELNHKMATGFLHLPQTTENIVPDLDRVEPGPSLPFATLIKAVTVTVDCVVRELADNET